MKTITVLNSQATTVARAVGESLAHVRAKMQAHAAEMGARIEFVEALDPAEGGCFMAHTARTARDQHAGTCGVCGVSVFHMDTVPANTVLVCVECGMKALAAEEKPAADQE